MTLSDTRRAEISVIQAEIKASTRYFSQRGVEITDPRDVLDALDIINRIELRIIENMQAAE